MKRLAILTLLASPAFAHQTQFNNPAFLRLSKGDPIKAQILSWYCDAKGGSKTDCMSSLAGSGNMAFEAALNCQQRMLNNHIAYSNLPTKNKEIPGARSHKADGVDWHPEYQREGNGRLHRHGWANAQRTTAKNEAIRDVLVTWRTSTDATTGDATLTKTVTDTVSWERGIADFISMVGNGSISTATEYSKKFGVPESIIREAIEKDHIRHQATFQ